MFARGHAGLNLLIISPLMIPFGVNDSAIFIIILSTAVATLPDIDLIFEKRYVRHRTVTHNLLFASVMGVIIGVFLFYGTKSMLWFGLGFSSGFLAVVTHLVGDSFNHMKFKPLYPFSHKLIAFELCYSSDRKVNDSLMIAGTISFFVYLFVASGVFNLF